MKSRKARFFCETCGTEVSAGARSCPGCGKTFTAVRCPRCDFVGSVVDFSAGCPSCGYNVPSVPTAAPAPGRAGRKNALLPRRYYRIALIVLAVVALGLLAVLLFRA